MATKIGPKTVTQRDRSKNLVFCVDAACSRSYGGEPTTNIQTGGGGSGGGDFSSGSTSGWSFDGKTGGTFDIYTADTHSGSYCARLKNATNEPIALWRNITLTNGVTYTFSVWVKNLNCPTTPYFSSAGTTVSTVSGGGSFTGISGNWQRFHWTFTVTGSTGSFSPYVRTAQNAAQGYFLVDDMQIEQKSAPTPFTATSRTTTTAITNISGVGAQGTSLEATTFETYGQSLFKPTTRNVLASFDKNQGHIGGAYWDLDGTDEYINCDGNSAAVVGSATLTVTLWAKPIDDNNNQILFAINGSGLGTVILLRVSCNNPTNYFDVYAGSAVTITGTTDVADGNWHFFTYVRRGTGTNEAHLYVDGELQTSGTHVTALASGDLWSIGQEWDAGPTASQFFYGPIASCMVWSSALTAKEIKDIYIAQKGRFGK